MNLQMRPIRPRLKNIEGNAELEAAALLQSFAHPAMQRVVHVK
jgi:hypothetical protein